MYAGRWRHRRGGAAAGGAVGGEAAERGRVVDKLACVEKRRGQGVDKFEENQLQNLRKKTRYRMIDPEATRSRSSTLNLTFVVLIRPCRSSTSGLSVVYQSGGVSNSVSSSSVSSVVL